MIFSRHFPEKKHSSCIINNIDHIENHFLSANLYFSGDFPVWGFVRDKEDYQLCSDILGNEYLDQNSETQTDLGPSAHFDIYYRFFQHAGSVFSAVRPPLYPLLVSAIYSLFGFQVVYAYYLNLVMLALIPSLLIVFAFHQSGLLGGFAGVLSAGCFSWINPFSPYDITPNILTVLLFILLYFALRQAFIRQVKTFFFVSGLLMGALLLTRGIFLPFLFIFIFTFLFFYRHKFSILRKLSVFLGGLSLILIPWIVFINVKNRQTIAEQRVWLEKFKKDFPITTYENPDFLETLGNQPGEAEVVFRSLVGLLYRGQIADSSFIAMNNQLSAAALMYFHNEHSLSGGMGIAHFLYRKAYYYQMDSRFPVWKKIYIFYSTYSHLFYQILFAKLEKGYLSSNSFSLITAPILLSFFFFFGRGGRQNRRLGILIFLLILILSLVYFFGQNHFVHSFFLALFLFLPFLVFIFSGFGRISPDILLYFSFHCCLLFFTCLFMGNISYTGTLFPLSLFLSFYTAIHFVSDWIKLAE